VRVRLGSYRGSVTDQIFSALVAGGASIVGGLVVAGSNYALNRAQARDARRDAMRRSMTRFLALLNRVDHLLRVEPRPRYGTVQSSRLWSALPHLDYALGRLNTRLLNPGLDRLVESLYEALADAVVNLPSDVLPAMETVTTLMANSTHDADWWRRWEEAKGNLVVVFRSAAGQSVGLPRSR